MGRLDRAAALLTFRARAATVVTITTATASTTTTSAAAFETTLSLELITGLVATLATLVTATTASTAMTAAFVVAFTRLAIGTLDRSGWSCGRLYAEQAFKPTDET